MSFCQCSPCHLDNLSLILNWAGVQLFVTQLGLGFGCVIVHHFSMEYTSRDEMSQADGRYEHRGLGVNQRYDIDQPVLFSILTSLMMGPSCFIIRRSLLGLPLGRKRLKDHSLNMELAVSRVSHIFRGWRSQVWISMAGFEAMTWNLSLRRC